MISGSRRNMAQTTKDGLFKIIDLLHSLELAWWLDGGWGVDVLYGEQTREHRDIDINYDAARTEELLDALQKMGYNMDTDQLPVRAELLHPEYGYLDIHPFVIADEKVGQANPEGGFWEFPEEFFGAAVFEGRMIPCISLEGQIAFHNGYELREKDLHDLKLLKIVKDKQK